MYKIYFNWNLRTTAIIVESADWKELHMYNRKVKKKTSDLHSHDIDNDTQHIDKTIPKGLSVHFSTAGPDKMDFDYNPTHLVCLFGWLVS